MRIEVDPLGWYIIRHAIDSFENWANKMDWPTNDLAGAIRLNTEEEKEVDKGKEKMHISEHAEVLATNKNGKFLFKIW